jgi:hypothetical protein
MRKSLVLAAVAGASSIALLGGQAGALSLSPLVPAILLPSGSQHVAAMCAAVPAAVGVGSTGGVAYEVVGAGTSLDPNVASQLECKFYDTDTAADVVVFRSGFNSGLVLAASYTVHTLDNLIVCVRVDSIDTNGNVASTPWTSGNNAPCGS